MESRSGDMTAASRNSVAPKTVKPAPSQSCQSVSKGFPVWCEFCSLSVSAFTAHRLTRAKGWVLGLEFHDRRADRWRKDAHIGGRLRREEAHHPELVAPIGFAVAGARRDLGFLSPLDWQPAEEHDGPDQLIARLSRPGEPEPELIPILGGLDLGTPTAGHR